MGRKTTESSTAELADAIGQLHALELAVRRRLLGFVAAYDHREAWREDGATSMAAWLVTALGVSFSTASQWVDAAARLEELPAIAAAYAEGRLSHDQLRPVLSLATPERDDALAAEAPGRSAAELRALAKRARCTPREPQPQRRSLRWWWDDDDLLNLAGRLPAAEGEVVVRAVERLADQAPPDPATGLFESYEARCADALVDLAGASLAGDPDPDRATVVVHADVELLSGGEGVAELGSGQLLGADTARRLACDCRVQLVADGPAGRPLGVGRTRRTVPPWLARLLRRRDGGCRFPACGRARWAHAHHLRHWADGGPTDAANLISLCRAHHKLVHEGGWRIEGSPDGDVRFLRPDGRAYQPIPPPLRPDLRARLLSADTS